MTIPALATKVRDAGLRTTADVAGATWGRTYVRTAGKRHDGTGGRNGGRDHFADANEMVLTNRSGGVIKEGNMRAKATKEKPIPFSGPMVRAILDGRKTQTRRCVNPQPADGHNLSKCEWYHPAVEDRDGYLYPGPQVFGFHCEELGWICPYGAPGERLWVRETWRPILSGLRKGGFDYRADDPGASGDGFMQWKPSSHMPRRASRLTLEITGIRAEPLQKISKSDALAEGFDDARAYGFRNTWDSLNGDRGFAWSDNPWVWVIEFKRYGD